MKCQPMNNKTEIRASIDFHKIMRMECSERVSEEKKKYLHQIENACSYRINHEKWLLIRFHQFVYVQMISTTGNYQEPGPNKNRKNETPETRAEQSTTKKTINIKENCCKNHKVKMKSRE